MGVNSALDMRIWGRALSSPLAVSDADLTPVSSVGHLPVISSPEMTALEEISIHLGIEISSQSHFVPEMALLVPRRVISFPRRPFLAVSNPDVTRYWSRTQIPSLPFRLRPTRGGSSLDPSI